MSSASDETDTGLDVAERIVKATTTKSTARRYRRLTELYVQVLTEMKINPVQVDSSGARDRRGDPIASALELRMQRCGPKNDLDISTLYCGATFCFCFDHSCGLILMK